MKRVFLIVLDSFGIGNAPDAADFNDYGANTIKTVSGSKEFDLPNMRRLGLFNIDGVDCCDKFDNPTASYGRLIEKSKGKDTTIGHWEIGGIISEKPLPIYPNGFPNEIIEKFENLTGRKVLCNLPYSGTKVIEEYGDEHVKTGNLIVYTSADSVFQIAAHEKVVPLDTLYEYCRTARSILVGEHAVGRVIARPFIGENGNYTRTSNRHDFSLVPPCDTMLDVLMKNNKDTISIGKIYDIFAGKGISEKEFTAGNTDGLNKTLEMSKRNFNGLCFVNLVDFDMLYGHRNDIDGYAKALNEFDCWLSEFIPRMREEDMLIITADHGCDPGFPGTDHSREAVPYIAYGKNVIPGNIGTIEGFDYISKEVINYLL